MRQFTITRNICLFRESAFALYKEQWTEDIWTKLKLRTLKIIKYEYGAENYVLYNLSKKRSLYFQLLLLKLEKNRFVQCAV